MSKEKIDVKIKEISVKLELSTTPKPYSSVKNGIILTATVPDNQNPDEIYEILYEDALAKVMNSINQTVEIFKENLQE